MIVLTGEDGTIITVADPAALSIRGEFEGGTLIKLSFFREYILVRESPDEIQTKVERHGKETDCRQA